MIIRIYPVIHHKNEELTIAEAAVAFNAGADGVFLISHHGQDNALIQPAITLKASYPDKRIGLNLLSNTFDDVITLAIAQKIEMIWVDAPGVRSEGISRDGLHCATRLKAQKASGGFLPEVFGSVAFKYQPIDLSPGKAAIRCLAHGMLPTTSGTATGMAPDVEKIKRMRAQIGPQAPLAIASGMTLENIEDFAPFLTHVLVSTGLSLDEYRLDGKKLAAFIDKAKSAALPVS